MAACVLFHLFVMHILWFCNRIIIWPGCLFIRIMQTPGSSLVYITSHAVQSRRSLSLSLSLSGEAGSSVGSASDLWPKGCRFESRQGQKFVRLLSPMPPSLKSPSWGKRTESPKLPTHPSPCASLTSLVTWLWLRILMAPWPTVLKPILDKSVLYYIV